MAERNYDKLHFQAHIAAYQDDAPIAAIFRQRRHQLPLFRCPHHRASTLLDRDVFIILFAVVPIAVAVSIATFHLLR